MAEDKRRKLIGETDFRELFHKVVFIYPTDEVRDHLVKSIPLCAEDEGFLAYGYIDNQAGFSFRILCAANINDNTLNYGVFSNETGYIIRRGYFNNCSFLDVERFGLDISDFDEQAQEYIRVINECYKCSEQTEEMRALTFLDPLRSTDYPDDIQVLLCQNGMQIERVWVRCFAYTEDELFGILLNEPNQDFGVHRGSMIGFAPVETKEGLLCVYTGRWIAAQSE